ncbi:bifunctional glycosyltransferase/CDP-glycerol:glycerophosphate glycerophosphotransferase [Nocardioides sp. URHA0020]|uniref:bifunctional glycosyltransferase/CDP-glycerol:glycerophosphate glycerophosphotransferase n=1 Tax=Nocardioides sp. URHA0020 TaxID=1380392 RepID=UPI00048C8F19|nr:CDP-glycerol glycerophosphotransferase family protein [Nocardioides sp. URHA0020]
MSDRELRHRSTAVARRVLRSARRHRPASPAEPVLTVVIPVYNVEAYLAECLDSVLAQSLAELEVIAVDDGSTDGSPQVLAAYAARDPRLRVLTQPNSGQGIARNAAVALARGEFLTFCDSDDVVPRTAYAHMVDTLRRSGSDLCVGAVRRFTHRKVFGTSWATVHDHDRLGTTLDESPDAMQDIIACNRMFRTAFWRDRVPPFRGHIAYEDHVPMLAAYVRAERFDLLARVTYRWRMREDNTSTGQQKADIENLLDRIAVKEEAHDLLRAEASATAYDAWVARTLDIDFQPFIEPALAAGEMYRNVLAAAFATMLERATEAALGEVRFVSKVRSWLCAHGEWDTIVDTDEYFRTHGRHPAVSAEGQRLMARLDDEAPFVDLVPRALWGLARHESRLDAGLRSATWTDRTLDLSGYVVVRGLSSVGNPPAIEAWLHDDATGTRLDLQPRAVSGPGVTALVRAATADYDESGFEVSVDLARLVTTTPTTPTTWSLRLRVRQGEVVREGGLHSAVEGSPAARLRARVVDGSVLVRPVLADHGLEIVVAPVPVSAEPGRSGPGTVSGRLVGDVRGVALALRPGDRRVAGDLTTDGRFEIALPGDAPWVRGELLARVADGQEVPVPPAAVEPDGRPGPDRSGWTTSPRGHLEVLADARRAAVREVRVDAATVTYELDAAALGPAEVRAGALVSDHARHDTAEVEQLGDGVLLVFPRRVDRWGTGTATVVPTGNYRLEVTLADGTVLVAQPTDELGARLPAAEVDGDLRLNLRVRRTGHLGTVVAPPLSQRDGTTRGQQLLRTAYRHASGPADGVPTDSVLLVSADGWQVDGHPFALDRELARKRPELVRFWGVRSHELAAPQGSVPVVIGSPAWYDVLRTSRYLCVDGDLDTYVEKRPHQRLLQTFRGRPFKAMGRSLWEHQGLSEARIERETARRQREWDAVLAPDEAAAELYRREFAYAGPTITTGSPRCDLVLGRDRESTRRDVLAGLGLPEDATVVLYAPTYRDTLSPRVPSAGLFAELDLDRLTRGLGPDHVVLLRAHPLDRRESLRAVRGTSVVDVTDHPDLAGLLLTADAAILDYSSLRFDWALTGRPAVCFVPDREHYLRVRPSLFAYDDTVAGPQLSTTEEVVDRLRDLPRLAAEQHDAIAEINRRFNGAEDGAASARAVAAFFTD